MLIHRFLFSEQKSQQRQINQEFQNYQKPKNLLFACVTSYYRYCITEESLSIMIIFDVQGWIYDVWVINVYNG